MSCMVGPRPQNRAAWWRLGLHHMYSMYLSYRYKKVYAAKSQIAYVTLTYTHAHWAWSRGWRTGAENLTQSLCCNSSKSCWEHPFIAFHIHKPLLSPYYFPHISSAPNSLFVRYKANATNVQQFWITRYQACHSSRSAGGSVKPVYMFIIDWTLTEGSMKWTWQVTEHDTH